MVGKKLDHGRMGSEKAKFGKKKKKKAREKTWGPEKKRNMFYG